MKEVKSISFCVETFYCTKHYFLYQITADPRCILFISLTSRHSLLLWIKPWKQLAAVLLHRAAGCSGLLQQPEHPDKQFGLQSWQRMQLHLLPRLSLSLWHINPPQRFHSPRAVSSSSNPLFHRGSHQTGAWRVLAGCKFVDCGALWLVNVLGSWAAWSGFLMGTNQSRGKQGAVGEERDRSGAR